MNIRFHSLDYLRGIMACAVMIYHYSYWTFGDFDSSTILGRLGLYGVSFFYILSGLTLYIVYRDYPISLKSASLFGIKRFFRIYPLLWLVTVIYVVAYRITDIELLFLNFSGLFGFLKPEAYIGVGVWSIGNELVFYAFFPLLMLFRHWSKTFFLVSILIIFFIGIYFGFRLMEPDVLLANQWETYVNPFNQFYLFAGGMLIGHLVDQRKGLFIKRKVAAFLILALVLLFCFYPQDGDVIAIVTGWQRLIFSMICFSLCFIIYVTEIKVKDFLHRILAFVGATSYSIYLLHPIGYKAVKGVNDAILTLDVTWVLLPFAILATLVLSFLSYEYFEKPMIQVGAKLTSRIKRTAPAKL